MKTILTLLALFISITGQAQEKITIGRVTVTLPEGTTKFVDKKLESQLMKVYENKEFVDKMTANAYKIGAMILNIRVGSNKSSDYLIKEKNKRDNQNHSETSYTSHTKVINGNDVLITYVNGKTDTYCNFQMFSKIHGNTLFYGSLKFEKADMENAQVIIDQILNSIVIK